MKKYSVITFLFNNYDLLREPLIIDENADYYCLSDDKNLSSKTWNCIYIEEFDTNSLLGTQKTFMAKYSFLKYIPNDYEYFITIDASIEVADNLSPIIKMMEENNFNIGLSMHNYRNVWDDEYKLWIEKRGLLPKYKEIFDDFSRKNGFDPSSKTGLIECTMKIYKNEFVVKSFIEDVYSVLKTINNFEDINDQCYFTCVLSWHINNFKPLYFCRQLYCNSKYFNLYCHKTNRLIFNEVTVEKNPNFLFGENVIIKKFDE